MHRKGEWFRVVTEPSERMGILRAAHYSSLHGSWRATQKEVVERKLYWQYLHLDCVMIARKCEDCQMRKGKCHDDELPPMTTGPRAVEVNDLASIDLKTVGGKRYMVLVVDYLSHHIEGAILPDKTALSVARYLYKLFLRNDPPTLILSDNGGEFKNQVAAECKEEWKMGRRFITPENPKANGVVERMNGVISDFMSKLGDKDEEWEESLDEALAVYNRKFRPSIGCAPNTLWFGRKSRMAILDIFLEEDVSYTVDHVMKEVEKWEKDPNWSTAIEQLKRRKERLINSAVEAQARKDMDQKIKFDRRNASKLNSFIPGEYVQVKATQNAAKMEGRFAPLSRGP